MNYHALARYVLANPASLPSDTEHVLAQAYLDLKEENEREKARCVRRRRIMELEAQLRPYRETLRALVAVILRDLGSFHLPLDNPYASREDATIAAALELRALLSEAEKCPHCGGTGDDGYASVVGRGTCPQCQGKGTFSEPEK